MFDEQGKALSTFDVLSKISEDWDSMTQAEQSSLALAQAGKTQIDVYTSVLGNFSTALEASATAMNSSGSAMKENEAYMKSIKAKLAELRAEFELLVTDGGGLSKFIKGVIEAGTAILKFANSDVGGFVIAMTAFSVVLSKIPALLIKVTASIAGLEVAEVTAIISTEGLAGAWELLTAAMATNPIGLILIGITALITGIGALVIKSNEAVDTLGDLHDQAMEFSDSLTEITSKVDGLNASIKAIENKKLEITDKEQLAILEAEEQSLKNQLAIALEKQRIESAKANESAKKSLGEKIDFVDIQTGDVTQVDRIEGLSKTDEYLKRLEQTYSDLQTEMAGMAEANQTDTREYKNKESALAELEKQIELGKEGANELAEALLEESSQLDLTDEESKKLADSINLVVEAHNKSSGSADDAKNSTSQYADALDEEAISAEESASAEEARAQALADSLDATNAIISSIDELSSAFQEESENGEISVATQLKMIEDGYALALSYDATTGACTINKEAVIALMEAKIQEQIANLQLLRTDLATKMKNDANVALTSAGAFLALANAKGSALTNLTTGKVSKTDKTQLASYDAQIKVLQNSLKSIKNVGTGAFSGIGKSAKSAGKSAKSAGGSTKKATDKVTDALKEQQKVLQDTVDKYEKVISYINKKVDDRIDKLEELKDAELDAIDAQIDALETQRDAEEKYWDDKIDALNAQNDALEDQIKLEQLLQALALAQSKKVRIFREGKGFVYESDQSAVSEAQQDLAEYQREAQLKAQIKELEMARDAKLALYDKQIKDLEAYKKSVEANYDTQIKYFEDWKDKFKEQTDAFENEQNRLLTLQLTGIDFENNNWTTRINNLSSFVDKYRQYQQELANITAQINASADSASGEGDVGGGGRGGGSSSNTPTAPTPKKINGYQGKVKYTGKYPVTYNGSTYRTGQVATFKGGSPQDVASQIASFIRACGKSYAKQIGGIGTYATGVASVTGDQMAITGEGNNRELVLGSKANGTLTKLDKGAGVVNAKSLKTFAGILNTIGASGMTGRTSSQISNMSNSNSTTNSNSINIDNLTIQANNPKEFEGWARRMLQVSYS